jgi:putative FmdB family regulatory protein
MPIYNYKCEDCGADFEIKATLEEKENVEKFKCLSCDSVKIKQQITGTNFISKNKESGGGCEGGCCGGMCG